MLVGEEYNQCRLGSLIRDLNKKGIFDHTSPVCVKILEGWRAFVARKIHLWKVVGDMLTERTAAASAKNCTKNYPFVYLPWRSRWHQFPCTSLISSQHFWKPFFSSQKQKIISSQKNNSSAPSLFRLNARDWNDFTFLVIKKKRNCAGIVFISISLSIILVLL